MHTPELRLRRVSEQRGHLKGVPPEDACAVSKPQLNGNATHENSARTILGTQRFPFLAEEKEGSVAAHAPFPGSKRQLDNITIKAIVGKVQRRKRKQKGRKTQALASQVSARSQTAH